MINFLSSSPRTLSCPGHTGALLVVIPPTVRATGRKQAPLSPSNNPPSTDVEPSLFRATTWGPRLLLAPPCGVSIQPAKWIQSRLAFVLTIKSQVPVSLSLPTAKDSFIGWEPSHFSSQRPPSSFAFWVVLTFFCTRMTT